MINLPYKIVLTSPDGRQFVRYKHKRAEVFLEVFQFEDENIFKHKNQQLEKYFSGKNEPYLAAALYFDAKAYLFVAIDVFYYNQYDQLQTAKKLLYSIKRLADWYKYTHLIPQAKAEENIT